MIKYSGKDKFKKKVAEILNDGGLGTKPKWEDIQEKPDTFPPSEHNHDDRYFTEAEIIELMKDKADSDHNHDGRYYTEDEVNELLKDKANSDHNHDGRYYTEDEINEMMKGKADSDHNHDGRYNTKDELASLLDNKLSTTLKGAAGGLAELDENGKVPASQLPSYVDDVIEGYYHDNYFYEDAEYTLMIVGEARKIYIDLITNKTYRWSGSIFTVISETLDLGETSSTAYRGDRGKTAYEHSQSAHAPADAQKNVQSDWNATSGDALILNKPEKFPPESHTHKSITLDNGMVINFYETDDGYITANSSKQDGSSIILEFLKAEYANSAGSVNWNNIQSKPDTFTPSSHNHSKAEISDFPSSLPASGGTADYASSAGNADTVDGQHFHWSGQGGQPTWLWGGNDYGNMYVYNPANFSVNYADSAGNADTVDGYHASIDNNGNQAVVRNANGYIYVSLVQCGDSHFHSDGNIYLPDSAWSYKKNCWLFDVLNDLNSNKSANGHNHSGNTLYPSGLQVTGGWLDWLVNGSIAFHIWCDGSQTYMRNASGGAIYLRADGNVGVKNKNDTAWAAVFASGFVQQSSRLVKENINPIDDNEAEKLLLLNPVSFDYKENFGGNKGLFGLIAEETLEVIPSCVLVPDNYSEENFNEEKGINQPILAIDYSKLVPHLIKMIQIHEKRISELEREIKELKGKS